GVFDGVPVGDARPVWRGIAVAHDPAVQFGKQVGHAQIQHFFAPFRISWSVGGVSSKVAVPCNTWWAYMRCTSAMSSACASRTSSRPRAGPSVLDTCAGACTAEALVILFSLIESQV